jgi:tetratricopeptide (TPR) repeat protein/V8-like Glu-specific endopeptidase
MIAQEVGGSMGKYIWSIGLGVTSALVQVVPSGVNAKTPVQVGEIARQIAVRVENKANNSNGSGTIIQRNGDTYTVLTAAHVLRGAKSFEIFTPDGRNYRSNPNSIKQAPGNLDLATFQFTSNQVYRIAKLGNSQTLAAGSNLYVAGFPGATTTINAGVFNFTKGEVTANAAEGNAKGYSLIYSNPTLPGMSGGPVLNERGELVAIHGQGDRSPSGQKTGFNLGIVVEKFPVAELGLAGRTPKPLPTQASPKADDYFLAANEKYDRGDYNGALSDYNRAITMNPKYAFAYNNRANLYLQQRELPKALTDYNRAIALRPNLALAYSNRGTVKTELKDYPGAMADYNRAISLDPKDDLAFNNRGFLKDEKFNDVAGALADYDRAIAINPYQIIAYNNRGNLQRFKKDNRAAALKDYDRAISLSPNNALVYYNRADLQYFYGNKSTAIADFAKVVELAPRAWIGAIAQGVIDLEQGRFPQALGNFQRSGQLGGDALDRHKYQGLAHSKLGDRRAAQADWRQAAKIAQQRCYQPEYQLLQSLLR